MKKIIAVALCIIMMVSMMSFNFAVSAEEYELMSDVYVSASGTDNAPGLENDPCTRARAYVLVKDGGTIHIDGTVMLPDNFNFGSYNKSVTIIGDNTSSDVLDFSNMPESINLGADMTFDYISLKFNGHSVYANAHALVVGNNCATEGTVSVYGGGNGGSVNGNTSVTLLSGKYYKVYGGGNLCVVDGNTRVIIGGTADAINVHGGGYGNRVTGNTYVWVGDNANGDCTVTDHSGSYYIIGGAYSGIVEGSTTVVFTGNAQANYIIGGMDGADQYIGEGSNLYITGGKAMSAYGGSNSKDQMSDVNVVMTGGEIEQLIGAGSGRSGVDVGHTGNVTIKLLGGTITRRVFGGCYNEYSLSGGWVTSGYVSGTITLVIGDEAKITFTYNDGLSSDHALSAQSRRKNVASDEEGVVIFTSDAAQKNNSLKTGMVAGGDACKSQYVDANVIPAGDANLDGEVTNADVLAVMQNIYSPEKYPLFVDSVADVNTDNDVTSVDLLIIYKMIYNAD